MTLLFLNNIMGFYWIKTNRFIKAIFPRYIWDIPNAKKVYLTFDDGPTPDITQWVLAQLKEYNAKATFFCIGNNIESHPEIFCRIIDEGHAIGNHTFDHLNGWNTNTLGYISNVKKCEDSISKTGIEDQKLFRPPYGKIKREQAKILIRMDYKIIMWDVLSADFDHRISPQQCLENVLKHIEPGSVVIFHDSVKGFKNLEYALPQTLAFLKEKGLESVVIS